MSAEIYEGKGGEVLFGCDLINGLYTPFIQITTSFGKTIKLTADCGVEKLEDGKRFCEFLFGALSRPRGEIRRFEHGVDSHDA